MNVLTLARWFVLLSLLCINAAALSAGSDGNHSSRQLYPQPSCPLSVSEHSVQFGPYQLYVRELQGSEPPIVLLHGFPDNTHLYDRLVPYLCGRHVVLFDFLGWGNSDKPQDYSYSFANQRNQLDEVITQMGLRQPVLVAHDASGPAAINWSLDHRRDIGALVLLNTFYHLTPSLSAPEAITIFADLLELRTAPLVHPTQDWSFARLSEAMASDPRMFRWLYFWQVGQFFHDDVVRRQYLPRLYAQFTGDASSVRPFVELNRDLGRSIQANTERAAELSTFSSPVRIIFGADDPYLNAGMAQEFHASFPTSDLFLIPDARHYVQMDEPQQVANLILTVPSH